MAPGRRGRRKRYVGDYHRNIARLARVDATEAPDRPDDGRWTADQFNFRKLAASVILNAQEDAVSGSGAVQRVAREFFTAVEGDSFAQRRFWCAWLRWDPAQIRQKFLERIGEWVEKEKERFVLDETPPRGVLCST